MLTLQDINEAYYRINSFIHNTPILTNTSLNQLTGSELYFKCENFQKTGSFKIRGAMNTVLQLSESQLERGLVTASSGNHGAAISMAATICRSKVKVIMPKNTPKIKIDNVKRNNGEIIWCDPNQASRDYILESVLDDTNGVLVHPYNDERVMAGQGTIAKELLENVPELDIIITPVSGGGLLSGTICAIKSINNNIQVFGAEPLEADDTYRSLIAGKIQSNETTDTICDGLRAQVGTLPFPIINKLVDDIITLTEQEIISALKMIMERMKIIVEPSCSITLAAVLKRKDLFLGKKVGLILTGGNIDLVNVGNLFDIKDFTNNE